MLKPFPSLNGVKAFILKTMYSWSFSQQSNVCPLSSFIVAQSHYSRCCIIFLHLVDTRFQSLESKNVGKCRHGGIRDDTRGDARGDITVEGGINKQSSSKDHSPHLPLT